MDHCDVLIVGAGPAGSSLAWRLKDSGLDVLMMDKQTFPRDKLCAGWITPQVVTELGIDLTVYAQGRVLEPLCGFRVCVMGGREVEVRYPGEPISYGIRRFEFDHYLLERCGARQRLGEAFVGMRRDHSAWVVNDAIRAQLVVGAGGHFCPVARTMEAPSDRSVPVILAKEIEFALSADTLGGPPAAHDLPELIFCDDFRGYGWVFRKGDFLNVGIGREDDRDLSRDARAISSWLKDRGKIPRDAPDPVKGHAYLLYPNSRRRIVEDGLVLIGDAAGLAYAQSGEGIRPAVESALLSGTVIINARGDYRKERLQPYEELVKARFGARVAPRSLSDHLPASIKQFLGRTLFSSRALVRHVVLNQWFLHAAQPALRL